MHNTENPKPIPLSQVFAVLVGFPIIATLISLLLLRRTLITDFGLDFFNTFWIIVSGWYLVQILAIRKIITHAGWQWTDIGFFSSGKQTLYFVSSYLVVAIGLLVFVEVALANSVMDDEKLRTLSSLTPRTTAARIIFIIMGLLTGLAEEIVYRGFAISALASNKVNKWVAMVIAAIPFVFQHGLKSIDQFWWFLTFGLFFGVLFVLFKRLTLIIIIHWLVILSAMLAILQTIQ